MVRQEGFDPMRDGTFVNGAEGGALVSEGAGSLVLNDTMSGSLS